MSGKVGGSGLIQKIAESRPVCICPGPAFSHPFKTIMPTALPQHQIVVDPPPAPVGRSLSSCVPLPSGQ